MTIFSEPPAVSPGNVATPERGDGPVTSRAELDAAIADLANHRDAWAAVGIPARIALVDRLAADTAAVAARWIELECERRHLDRDGPAAGDQWGPGPWCALAYLRRLRTTLGDIERHGRLRLPGARMDDDGRVWVRVMPADLWDRTFFPGFSAEVRRAAGVTAADAGATYRREASRHARVGVVLGAGNVSSIPFLDVVYKLFAEDQVVVLKLSPVNADLEEVFAHALGALIEPGYLRIIQGGAEEAQYLVRHPAVEAVHVTGSDKTYEALVFGTGPQAAARKAENRPLLDKPITAELGNVTPVVVVPGQWRDADFERQARSLASMLVHGSSYECIAPRVLVTAAGWDGRERLLSALRRVLAETPNRFAFYPGAQERFALFTAAHADAELLGSGAAGSLPWALIPGVDPSADDLVFTTDPFAPILAETSLAASSRPDFLERAVGFCNERLWGTLGATLIVHPRSLRAPATRAAFDRALGDLRYGTIVVNAPTFIGFTLPAAPWGAYPGHTDDDIRSGRGVVHNGMLLGPTEKTVVRAPFRSPLKPVWWPDHRRADEVMRGMTDFEAQPRLRKLPAIVRGSIMG